MSTILIIDDLAANRRLLVHLLGSQGHRMLEATDGGEGLAIVRAEHPDLIITDVLMPVMDGYEFVKQLRLDPASRTIPVVFYTAHYGEREARELALSSGVSHVVKKPVEAEVVLQLVARILTGELQSPPWKNPRSRRISTVTTFACSPTSSLKRPSIYATRTPACGG